MKKILLTLLAAAPIAFAQSDCGSCDDTKAVACDTDAKACSTDLATARKDLSSWKADYKKMSRIERDSLKAARSDLLSKDMSMKALAPTFGAQADMLAALAAIERMGSKESTQNAQLASEMSKTYRAMARALAGKDSYPAPKLDSTDDLKTVLKNAAAEAAKAKEMWAAAKTAKLSAEDTKAIEAARKLMKQSSPRMRAIALNAGAVMKGYKGLNCGGETAADGDPRPMLMKTSKELHKMAAPYFAGVKMEKPKPEAPAPST